MATQTYLFFEGRTEEAFELYRQVLGAEIQSLMRFADAPGGAATSPDGSAPPADKIMHASAVIGGTPIMASDGNCSGKPEFDGFSLVFEVRDKADAERRFSALAEGGEVRMPLAETFFADAFGRVVDKFGVSWMIIAGMKRP